MSTQKLEKLNKMVNIAETVGVEIIDYIEDIKNEIKEDVEDVKSTILSNIKGNKGDKGDKGEIGENGKDGYTPIKNIDYFDGKNGADGKNGKDGKDGINGENGKDGYTFTPDELISEIHKSKEKINKEKIDFDWNLFEKEIVNTEFSIKDIKGLEERLNLIAKKKGIKASDYYQVSGGASSGGASNLEDLLDTDITNKLDRDTIRYNSTDEKWDNLTFAPVTVTRDVNGNPITIQVRDKTYTSTFVNGLVATISDTRQTASINRDVSGNFISLTV